MNRDKVVLVDKDDVSIGSMEKIAAHKEGKLHRAFSVFVFNQKGDLLIQKRAAGKYHCGGLWSNTCCSHPQPDETDLGKAAAERLYEEMGISCLLQEVFHFIYRAEFDNGLIEHELDHVFVGVSDALPKINQDEVDDWKWVDPKELKVDMSLNPGHYTAWFKISIDEVLRHQAKGMLYEEKTAGRDFN